MSTSTSWFAPLTPREMAAMGGLREVKLGLCLDPRVKVEPIQRGPEQSGATLVGFRTEEARVACAAS